MKILFDNQIFSWQRFGGISNYFARVIAKLPKNTQVKLSFMYTDNVYLKDIGYKYSNMFSTINFKGKNRIKGLCNNIFNIFAIMFDKYDIFHPTYYSNYFVRIFPRNKLLVVTVYDMIHELFPEYFNEKSLEYKTKKLLCTRADKIIAISSQTKHDLIQLFSIPENKIEVIYLGTNFTLLHEFTFSIEWLPEKYLLFVGTRSGYKNFNWMLQALVSILKSSDYKLVVIGSPFTPEESDLIKQLGINDSIIINNVHETLHLQEVYNRAKLFIFPSLYEGFGIPILEAFASKVPVLLTNASCFPEIAKDAALYFEPEDQVDFQNKVNLALNSYEIRQHLIQNGISRLNEFSWEKTAKETNDLYTGLLNSRKES